MRYHDALKQMMEDQGLDAFAQMTDEKLREGIAAISAELKGPMPNHERIFQAGMRRGMQMELERRTATPPDKDSA